MKSIECVGARVRVLVTVCSLAALSGACDARAPRSPGQAKDVSPTAQAGLLRSPARGRVNIPVPFIYTVDLRYFLSPPVSATVSS